VTLVDSLDVDKELNTLETIRDRSIELGERVDSDSIVFVESIDDVGGELAVDSVDGFVVELR
jgi:hypothetical protein